VLYETVIGASLACVDEVLEAERVALCGEPYAHLVDREASTRRKFAGPVWQASRRKPATSAQRGRLKTQSYRVGSNGVRAIRCSSAGSSRWEYRPGGFC